MYNLIHSLWSFTALLLYIIVYGSLWSFVEKAASLSHKRYGSSVSMPQIQVSGCWLADILVWAWEAKKSDFCLQTWLWRPISGAQYNDAAAPHRSALRSILRVQFSVSSICARQSERSATHRTIQGAFLCNQGLQLRIVGPADSTAFVDNKNISIILWEIPRHFHINFAFDRGRFTAAILSVVLAVLRYIVLITTTVPRPSGLQNRPTPIL